MYIAAEMEIIKFETEDVITASDPPVADSDELPII